MKRKYNIDALKGLGIIFVVLGHCSINNNLLIWIYSFHMPLFFLLSGYVSCDRSVRDAVKKEVVALLYPYFVMGVCIIGFNTLLDTISSGEFSCIKLGKRFIALIYGNVIWENNWEYIGVLWFLVALFCIKIISTILETLNRKMYWITFFVLVFIGIINSKYNMFFRMPFCFDVTLISFPFYEIGKKLILKMKNKYYLKICIALPAIFFLSGALMAYINSLYFVGGGMGYAERSDMLSLNLGNPVFFYIAALSTCISLIMISEIIYLKHRIKILEDIGSKSLLIMIVHLYVKRILDSFMNKINIINNPYLTGIVVFIISFILAVIIKKYLKKLYKFERSQK